jgi:hypothetical protein
MMEIEEAGAGSKSIAMKKLFSEKTSFQPLSRQPSGKRHEKG